SVRSFDELRTGSEPGRRTPNRFLSNLLIDLGTNNRRDAFTMLMSKVAIIIGAGPAGLTAAYELLVQTDIKPIVLEKTARIGGLATTINYKGNRMDIGGHRFFSKSDQVMEWWLRMLPLQRVEKSDSVI